MTLLERRFSLCSFTYIGQELEIFRHAKNWKAYWASRVKPFLAGDALEVGAGIGANTLLLRRHTDGRWVCCEPDQALAALLCKQCESLSTHHPFEIVEGTIHELPVETAFDTILYIDLLEHIQEDAAELRTAASRLRPGGHLIVLAPAWNFLHSEFDRSIGHVRRYTKRALRGVGPPDLELRCLEYLDSLGMLVSAGNKLVLHNSLPTHRQIRFWDSVLVPLSRGLDPWLNRAIGKSLLAVWRQPART